MPFPNEGPRDSVPSDQKICILEVEVWGMRSPLRAAAMAMMLSYDVLKLNSMPLQYVYLKFSRRIVCPQPEPSVPYSAQCPPPPPLLVQAQPKSGKSNGHTGGRSYADKSVVRHRSKVPRCAAHPIPALKHKTAVTVCTSMAVLICDSLSHFWERSPSKNTLSIKQMHILMPKRQT